MHTKIILGLILVLVIVAGGLFFFNKKTKTESMDTNNDSVTQEVPVTHTVMYTKDGFSPDTLEIQKGEAVLFTNKSGTPLWTASAMHPTHALYLVKSPQDCLGSSFDACAPTANDASWSFTFTEVGSWGYHNHLQASHRGMVVVK
mgnify:CR=1 FL=1